MDSRKRVRERGSAMVETALILLAMLLLMLGLFEGAYVMWSYTTLSQAARHGARYAMARGTTNPATDDAIRDKVREQTIGLNRSNVQVLTTWIPDRQMGSQVQLRVTYNLPLMTSTVFFSSSTLALTTTARATVTY